MVIADKKELHIGESHRNCFACGVENKDGLGLVFEQDVEHQVRCDCVISKRYQGYPGAVQGGIVATMLDCAMTNCLFTYDVEAMTVRLNVQYHLPVMVEKPLVIKAKLVNRRGRLYELDASIVQNNQVRASALGKFMVPKDDV